MADPELEKQLQSDSAQAAKLGANGTPAFFINGRFLSGAQPFDNFKALIDEELKKADKLIADGTPKKDLYKKIMETAKD